MKCCFHGVLYTKVHNKGRHIKKTTFPPLQSSYFLFLPLFFWQSLVPCPNFPHPPQRGWLSEVTTIFSIVITFLAHHAIHSWCVFERETEQRGNPIKLASSVYEKQLGWPTYVVMCVSRLAKNSRSHCSRRRYSWRAACSMNSMNRWELIIVPGPS